MITIEAQGSSFNFPDGTPPEEIQRAMAQAFPSPAQTPSGVETQLSNPETDPTYLGRMADKIGGGFSAAASSVAEGFSSGVDEMTATQTDPNTGLSTMWGGSEGVTKGGADIVSGLSGGIMSAVGGVASGIAGEGLTQKAKDAGEWVMGTDLAQKAGSAVKYASDLYNEAVEDSPMLQEMGSAVADSATITTGLLNPKAKLTTRTKFGQKGIDRLEGEVTAKRIDKVQDMLEPPNKKGLGDLDVDEHGKHVYKPSQFEQDVAAEINKIKGLKPSASFAKNHNVLRQEAIAIREGLVKKIEKAGDPAIDLHVLQSKLDDMANNITGMDGGFALVGDSKEAAQNMLLKLSEILEDAKPTALGVLEARKKFDKEVRRAYGNVFDPGKEQAKTIANKFIRDTLNDAVDEAVPGIDVMESLTRQHHLLYASDELLAKAFKERDTFIGRMVQNAENKIGLKIPTTPLALGTTAAVGAAAIGGAPAAVAGGLGALFAGYKGSKWLASPAGRTWGWKVVRGIEKDPLASKMLKTDRAILIEMLEGLRAGDEEE